TVNDRAVSRQPLALSPQSPWTVDCGPWTQRALHARGLHLLPRVIARPDERAGLDVLESHGHADVLQPAELFRRDVAIELDVRVRRPEVLAERENVDVDRAQIAHDDLDLLERLAHPENDAG